MSLALRPPRAILLIALVTLIILSLTTLRHNFSTSSFKLPSREYPEKPFDSSAHDDLGGASISLQSILDQIATSISNSISTFDHSTARQELGVNLDDSNITHYQTDLHMHYTEFFSNASQTDLLSQVLAYTSILPAPSRPLPKNVYTTDLTKPSELPEQFQSWATMNPEWNTNFVSDEAMDEWIFSSFPGEGGIAKEMKALKDKRGIVRADLFRYLVLLLNGGVYTDTDTACVRPISDWTQDPDDPTINPLLTSLPHLVRLVEQASDEIPVEDDDDDSPSLVVAIEGDCKQDESDWRGGGLVRGLQVAQWTILAKPGHPVMMDVLGRALQLARGVREAEEEGRQVNVPDVLDWTGPGAFTDAVLRYLLVKYGVHPSRLHHLARPVRYGDIVIMPRHSFRADASEGWQGEWRVVWHGFFGRWKSQG